MKLLSHAQLDTLLEALTDAGYRVIGPRVRDGAISFGELARVAELPIGWTDTQAPGRYRLEREGSSLFNGYVVGPDSPRAVLTPSVERLVQIRRRETGIEVSAIEPNDARPLALLGVRACDVAALVSHDRVWTGGPFVDPRYQGRREAALIIAVDCLAPGELCFCESTQTGPEVREGYDLRLTELDDGTLLLAVGTERGQGWIDTLERLESVAELEPAPTSRALERRTGLERAATQMRESDRRIDIAGAPKLLFENLDHPRWDDVAQRCLSCANCTLVCPTCFCHRVEEQAVVGAEASERVREWDSCFTAEHSSIHGAQFRPQTRERYRQWMTHKLASWVSQFGMSGCVGCGRCIAWCPVGIDITEELRAIAADPRAPAPAKVVELPPAHSYEPVAGDPMLPQIATVVAVEQELPDAVTLAIEPAAGFRFAPGQFNMLALPGIGEVAISISGQRGDAILHTIRAVGATSRALTQLRRGAELGGRGAIPHDTSLRLSAAGVVAETCSTPGTAAFRLRASDENPGARSRDGLHHGLLAVRGPFGRGWPLAETHGHPVVVIAGGLGLAPLRGALRELVGHPERHPSVRLLYGARSPDQVLYRDEILSWDPSITFHPSEPDASRHVKVHVTVDRAAPGWTGHVGVVTMLMRRKRLSPHAYYFVCGPEPMMRFVLEELDAIGVPETNTYVSMERNMKCAVGVCGRCQYGPHFVCKDGPVFRRDQLAGLFGREGF